MSFNKFIKQLSPIAKDPSQIGKLIIKKNNAQQNNSPFTKNECIGISTSKTNKWIEDRDNISPITHQISSPLHEESSQMLNKDAVKRINLLNIPTKSFHRNKRSPVGTIFKQENQNKSVGELVFKNEKNREGWKLPKIDESIQNIQRQPKKTNSERYSQISMRKDIGKTYTPSVMSRKISFMMDKEKRSDFEQQTELQNSKKKSVQNPQIHNSKRQKKEVVEIAHQRSRNLSPTSSINGFIYNKNPFPEIKIVINFHTSIAKIKQILVEKEQNINFQIEIPPTFFHPPSKKTHPEALHHLMTETFSSVDLNCEIMSIRKYINCVVMRDKDYAIFWNFNGKVYFGNWDKGNTKTQANKHGIGLEWVPKNYTYFGQFRNNQREGYGIMKKENKQLYIGCWKKNERNGWGRVYSDLGELLESGDFHDGCLIQQN